MPSTRRESFAPVDAAWLRMEDSTNLMMITGVLTFEQPVDFARLQETTSKRLVMRFERFRKRAVNLPSGTPYWEDDPDFNLGSHVHELALPAPGDQHALQNLVSDMMSTPLDFNRPPWQLHLVQGYGTGSALIVRLHHCIADGIALVHVMLSMTDSSPDEDMQADVSSAPKSTPDQAGGVFNKVRSTGESVLREGQEIVENPARILELARTGGDGLASLGKLLFMSPDPQTPLKGRLHVQKLAVWTEPMSLDKIKAIGKVTGSTINDVLLAAAAGTLRRYLIKRGVKVGPELNIRAVVPVNLRPLDRIPTMGNMFGVVFLSLPVGLASTYDRLVELRERMNQIKDSPEAVVAFGILTAIGSSPERIQNMAVNMFGSKATAVMTNVPGPREAIYLAGKRIRSCMFWVPQSGRLGLGVSIFSYAGEVLVGFATDQGLIPDPQQLIDGYHEEIDELMQLVHVVNKENQ